MAQSCRSFDTRQSPPFVNEDRDGDGDEDAVEEGIIFLYSRISSDISDLGCDVISVPPLYICMFMFS